MHINISKKRLEELASMSGDGCGCLSDAIKESAEMARFILALQEQEPFIDKLNGHISNRPEFPQDR